MHSPGNRPSSPAVEVGNDSVVDMHAIYQSQFTNPAESAATSSLSSEFDLFVDAEDMKNKRRIQLLCTFGPMQVVVPKPSFVVKTKRVDGTKIFVNFCTHDLVPFNSRDEEISENRRLIYLLVGAPVEHTNERDNNYCVVYDVVLSAQEVEMANNDFTGDSRGRVGYFYVIFTQLG